MPMQHRKTMSQTPISFQLRHRIYRRLQRWLLNKNIDYIKLSKKIALAHTYEPQICYYHRLYSIKYFRMCTR